LAAGGCTLDPSCPRTPAAMQNIVTAITARAAMLRDGMRAGRIPLARSPIYLFDYVCISRLHLKPPPPLSSLAGKRAVAAPK
jgi:hypothetical protein